MSTPTFTKTHNLIAFLEKPSESNGFEQIVDFLNIKTVNDDVQLQALIDRKKVVNNEASIKYDHKLNDAEGTSCLSNAVIFKELTRIGTMASAIICLANNKKFNFSKYILKNLKKNLEAGVPFYMFPRFIPVFVNHQLGDMSHHKGIFVNPSLTKKVFANMKRVGTGFSRAVTPLFGTMMVQATEDRRKIADIDDDAEVKLENVYNLDMAPEETVLSMQDVDVQSERIDVNVKEVAKEMVEVMRIAKIIVDEDSTAGGELNAANEKPVSVASTNITTAQPSEATMKIVDISTAPKAKGIVFHNKEESTTRTPSLKSQVKDKGKAKLVEEPEILKSRKAQIAIDEEVARRIEHECNADMKDNIDWNEVVEQDNTEKQKLKEQHEAEELKKNLEIVPDDEDGVFVNVTPLSSKPPTIMDYKIYKEGKKEHF
nr:hypothetical protein [Tanacetum cinerariifolium]